MTTVFVYNNELIICTGFNIKYRRAEGHLSPDEFSVIFDFKLTMDN